MKGVRLKALGITLLGVLALLFAGCGQQGGGGGNQTPSKGTLTVNVTPADAQVQVTGPGSFSQSFTGSQTLTNLDPGNYTIQASKTGYFSASATHQVEAGRTVTAVLNLLPIPAAAPTEGKVAVLVVNGNGNPIAGATVSDGSQNATTDAQGRADLTYNAAGAYAISVNASGYLGDAKLASVELGKTVALTFKLQPVPAPAPTTGTLVVHVYDKETGQTLTGASVSSNPALTFTGSNGLFSATASPGVYTVTGSAPGYQGQLAVSVEAGKTTVLNLGLQRTPAGPVTKVEILSLKDQWGVDLQPTAEKNPYKQVNLYASQTEEPICVTVRVTQDGQPVVGARVRVTAVSYDYYYASFAAALYKGCETQTATELDFVETDANGIAKFSFQGIGEGESYGLVKFLVSASGADWTARSQEFKVFFYNITHLILRDGGDDDRFGTPDDKLIPSPRRMGSQVGPFVNDFDFDNPANNQHLFRAEVAQKQPSHGPFPISGEGFVQYELISGADKVELCLANGTNCGLTVNDTNGLGILVRPKAGVKASDLPFEATVKATLYVIIDYGQNEYTIPLKDLTFTKRWVGTNLSITKSGPSVIGWSGNSLMPDDVTLPQQNATVPDGAIYQYSITVTNTGSVGAENVVITDPLPAELGFVEASTGGTYDPVLHQVTWDKTGLPSLTNIAPGDSVTVWVKVYARHKPGYFWNDNNRDGVSESIGNVGTPGYYYSSRPPSYYPSQQAHPDPYRIDNVALARGDNTPEVSTAKTIHVVRPFFTLSKTPTSTTVFQGDRVRFTLKVTNVDRATLGDADYLNLKNTYPTDYQAALTGYNLVLRDLFGTGLDYVNSSPLGTLDANAKTLKWDLGNLALGESTSVLVDLRASEVGRWQNCARLYAYNLNQLQLNEDYPRWNVAPSQFEPTSVTDPRPAPPYEPETANPDSEGNYIESCATVTVQERPTQYALAISSLGEFDSLAGGNSTDPVVEGSTYYYRFDVRAWEGSSGPQTNVTLSVSLSGNSQFSGTSVKGSDYQVWISTDGGATFSPVLAGDVTVTGWTPTGVTLVYNPGLPAGAILRYSLRVNAMNGTPTTATATAQSTQAPPVSVNETTTVIAP